MATRVNRVEVWMFEFAPPDKRRSVLVLTRQDAIRLLRTVMVAPITSSIRGAPSEVVVGIEKSLKRDSAVNLEHVQTVDQFLPRRYVETLSISKMAAVCRALASRRVVQTDWLLESTRPQSRPDEIQARFKISILI